MTDEELFTEDEFANSFDATKAKAVTMCSKCNALRFDPAARKAFAAHLAAVHNTTLVMMDEMR